MPIANQEEDYWGIMGTKWFPSHFIRWLIEKCVRMTIVGSNLLWHLRLGVTDPNIFTFPQRWITACKRSYFMYQPQQQPVLYNQSMGRPFSKPSSLYYWLLTSWNKRNLLCWKWHFGSKAGCENIYSTIYGSSPTTLNLPPPKRRISQGYKLLKIEAY